MGQQLAAVIRKKNVGAPRSLGCTMPSGALACLTMAQQFTVTPGEIVPRQTSVVDYDRLKVRIRLAANRLQHSLELPRTFVVSDADAHEERLVASLEPTCRDWSQVVMPTDPGVASHSE